MKKTVILFCLLMSLTATAWASTAPPEITAKPGQVNPYKTRAELLMEAMARVGVQTPEQAAALWADGLKARSAALQYAAMTNTLKAEYAAQLDAAESNWVTGMSSPWVDSYEIGTMHRPSDENAMAGIRFALVSSYGPPAYRDAWLRLVYEDGFWRVSAITADEELYPYTLYRAAKSAATQQIDYFI